MRIGIFTNNYFPLTSGVAVSIENFRRELLRLGHQVFVFAPGHDGQYVDPEHVFLFPSLKLSKNYFHYRVALPFTPAIDRVVKKANLDVIHSQHPFWIGHTAMWYARRLKKPLVFTYHTMYEEYSRYVPVVPQSFMKWYLKKVSLEYAVKSDLIIAPSESVQEILQKRITKYFRQEEGLPYSSICVPIRVVPSGIDVEKFKTSDGGELRNKYGFRQDDIVLVCVCRLAREKNLEFLIRSVAPLLRSQKNTYLVFVGHGKYRETLEILARELKLESKVRFTGLVPNNEIAAHYRMGDIFVYASKSETQGLVLAEALASRLPVVAISAPGIKDVIMNGDNGFLVQEDEDEFRNKIELVMRDRKLREKLGEAAVKTADDYSREHCTKKLVDAYAEATRHANERISRKYSR